MLEIEIASPVEVDARTVMDWRNDPVTLASFYHREPKVWETFWPEFRDSYFRNKEIPPIFVRFEDRRVAFLRFGIALHPVDPSKRCCDISINVSPKDRGRGLGGKVLRLASEFLRDRGFESVVAEIRVGNEASLRSFKGAAYAVFDETIKIVEDTGERCQIIRLIRNLGEKYGTNRGLFFDLDGTLADSLDLMKSVYSEFLDSFGIQGSNEEFRALNGPPLRVVIERLKATHRLKPSLDELKDRYFEILRLHYSMVPPNRGAAELLQKSFERGWKCAIVTSNSESLAMDWLRANHLEKWIDSVVGEESIQNGKPHPEPYITCLIRMNCDALKSFAIEDSVTGVRSALSARLATFAYQKTEGNYEFGSIPVRDFASLIPWIDRADD